MLRTRLLAAATAVFLMLGMSVAGAGTAAATPPSTNGVKVFVCKYVDTPGVDERLQTGQNPISVSVNAIPNYQGIGSYFADAQGRSYVLAEDTRTGGGQTGEPDVSECPAPQGGPASAAISPSPATCDVATSWNLAGASIANATWGSPSISGSTLTIVATAIPGSLFPAGAGVSDDRTTKTFTTAYEPAGGEGCDPDVATAAVTVTERNCFVATSIVADGDASTNVTWGDPVIAGGLISITATATDGALFDEGLEGVSDDRTQRTFSAPYQEAGGDDCVLPTIDVTASSTALGCDRDPGFFEAGPFSPDDENADKLLWTTTQGTVPSEAANIVSGPGTVVVTVRIADAHLGDFALNDVSGDGVVSIVSVDGVETALITWTFDFVEPKDCPTLAGSTASGDCVQDAPYLNWSIDLTDAAGSVSLPTVASLTMRSSTDPSLTYVFPDVPITSTGVTTGSALWPGAAVDGDGRGTAWPGWAFVDGEWVVDDTNFGWVRGADVELLIEVNPSIVIPVSYPNATPECANPAVVVPDVTETDMCEGTGRDAVQIATFTVTRAANVTYTYTVNGGDPIDVVFPDGEDTVTIAVSPLDMVEVTALPADGFRLPDGYEPWSHSFLGAAFCIDTFPTTEAAAEITLPDCLGNPGSIELTNGLGVIWTLNGEVVSGNTTHSVPTGTEVTLEASLEGPSDEYPGGFGWNDPEQQTEWTAVMEVDPGIGGEECLLDEDELPTLAFTGASGLTAGLGALAALMTVVGMGFVIRRHRVTA